MKKIMTLTSAFIALVVVLYPVASSGETAVAAVPERNITIAILAKDKAHTLPLYLACLENQTWPAKKTNLWIRTNNNNDATARILREWIEKVKDRYAKIYFDDTDALIPVQNYAPHEWNLDRWRVLTKIRQDSVTWAYEQNSHYFVADCDNFIKPDTIEILLKTNLPIVAPFLVTCNPPGSVHVPDSHSEFSKGWYSNYHNKIDAHGYFANNSLYYDILNQGIRGLLLLPVVHCTYFIRHDVLPEMSYDDGSNIDEYVIFSRVARQKNIEQYLDNRQIYGFITFADTQEQFAKAPFFNDMRAWLQK